MRVLLVNKFHWRKGGSETYYFSLAEGLRELGHEVFFFSMQDEHNEPCTESEFFVTNRDYSGSSSPLRKVSAAASLIYSPEAKRKFQALCEKVRPDVVHLNLVHRQITLSILDAPYLKKHHVPVVFTAHDYILVCPNYLMLDGSGNVCRACLKGKYLNCVRRSCVKASRSKSLLAAAEARFLRAHHSYDRIDRIISPSQFLADVLVEGGFDSSRVVVMRNFISPATDAPSDGTSKRPYFLCFGRLSKEKGVDLLIEAFAGISEQLPDWDLVIAGDGPERESLERMVATSACSHVTFTGHLEGEELLRIIGGASFACVCSRWYENMPYSILEALSLGVPVIGSNIGGIPEVVLGGQTGFLFQPGDVDSLRESLLKAASIEKNASQFSAMRRSCRKLILDTCDRDAYVRRIVELYRSLGAER